MSFGANNLFQITFCTPTNLVRWFARCLWNKSIIDCKQVLKLEHGRETSRPYRGSPPIFIKGLEDQPANGRTRGDIGKLNFQKKPPINI